MAGQDMSKNLGGMLSQTAGALGTMGSSYSDSLVRNIENMSRPDTDPTDIASQRQLMGWQNNMGRTDEAALTMANLRDMEAKQKAATQANMKASLAQRTEAIKTIMANENMTKEARTATIANIERSMQADAAKAGLDPQEFVGVAEKLSKQERANELQQIQLENAQSSQAMEQANAATEELIGKLVAAGQTPGTAGWNAAVKQAPAFVNNPTYVQEYEREAQLLRNSQAEEDARLAKDVAAASTITLTYPEKLLNHPSMMKDKDGNIASLPGQQLAQAVAEAQAFNDKPAGSREPGEGRRIRKALENATKTVSDSVARENARAATEQAKQDKAAQDLDIRIAATQPNKYDIETAEAEVEERFGSWLMSAGGWDGRLSREEYGPFLKENGVDPSEWPKGDASPSEVARIVAKKRRTQALVDVRNSMGTASTGGSVMAEFAEALAAARQGN